MSEETPSDHESATPSTDTGEATEWVDVRMTDPEAGEWDVDVVVSEGRVASLDLRVRPGLLGEFVDCLVEDMDGEAADRLLARLAERRRVDLGDAGEV